MAFAGAIGFVIALLVVAAIYWNRRPATPEFAAVQTDVPPTAPVPVAPPIIPPPALAAKAPPAKEPVEPAQQKVEPAKVKPTPEPNVPINQKPPPPPLVKEQQEAAPAPAEQPKDPAPAIAVAPEKKVVPPAPPQLVIAVTPEQQAVINRAVAKGVVFLKGSLNSETGREEGHGIGRVSLGGLTLLECGVRADDPAVKRAAKIVRAGTPTLRDTYSLALAILFLDRLGQPEDTRRIQTCALRLVAGQNARGGWTYSCPYLTPPQEEILLTLLRDLPPLQGIMPRPDNPLNSPVNSPGDLQKSIPLPADGFLNPLTKEPPLDRGVADPLKLLDPLSPPKKGGLLQAIPDLRLPTAVDPNSRERMPIVKAPVVVPPAFKPIPAVNVMPGQEVRLGENPGPEDHSNTQFAILGLWAARRHGVPMERTLVLIERRFRAAQNPDGSWGYQFRGFKQLDSMTCTGLLGMALALGVDQQLQGQKGAQGLEHPTVQKGLTYLGSTIGRGPRPVNPNVKGFGKGPGKGKGNAPGIIVGADSRGDLYYLWSLERVAVVYHLPTITGKDWYRWGANAILRYQYPDGSWRERHAGIPDTSFALLFLTRANLVRDLPQLARP